MRFRLGLIYIVFQLLVGSAYARDVNSDMRVESDSIESFPADSIYSDINKEEAVRRDTFKLPEKIDVFVPNSTKAVWYSAIFPGLGQIYNRKYWKLPIIYGGFVGITYGLAFNQRNYTDYSKAYKDAMDGDPNTNSYNDFLSPNSNMSMADIQKAMKRKKDFYRRYRDLSIIGLVALYAACMIDAYVDAELYTFDISPDLSLRLEPAVINPSGTNTLSNSSALGVQCRINF